MSMIQPLLALFCKALVKILSVPYGAEGINLGLAVLPTRAIAPILRSYGAAIGNHVRFRSPVVIHNASLVRNAYYANLSVGDDCYFGRELFLDLQDRVVIESKATLSHRVTILTHTDVGESPLKNKLFPPSQAPVTIRMGAYVGAGSIILPGVEIGQCAVVGAGAVVTRTVHPSTVVAGVPAREIRTLDLDSLKIVDWRSEHSKVSWLS